jgi:hypothetical protein
MFVTAGVRKPQHLRTSGWKEDRLSSIAENSLFHQGSIDTVPGKDHFKRTVIPEFCQRSIYRAQELHRPCAWPCDAEPQTLAGKTSKSARWVIFDVPNRSVHPDILVRFLACGTLV